MTNVVVSLYESHATASTVADELAAANIPRDRIEIISGSERALGTGGTGNIAERLVERGVPRDDARAYADGVERGGALAVAEVPDTEVDRTVEIMERHNPVDTDRGLSAAAAGLRDVNTGVGERRVEDETTLSASRDLPESRDIGTTSGPAPEIGAATGPRVASGPATGTTTGIPAGVARDTTATGTVRDTATGREEVIPVIEERLEVGKRAVTRGRVRVHSRIVETPVEETVALRDETVHVERRPVDRPAEVDADFRERTIEATETDEQAVVAKTARVTEELVVKKDVEQRTETVSDTVRRTEVDIDDDRREGAGTTERVERGVERDTLRDAGTTRDSRLEPPAAPTHDPLNPNRKP